ncbi:hypothetical protein C8J56DRAFT_59343 [Mycena floridula]|nr:hypothetical protein C8J56DRAFT_59343 [Mycena floridula]
MNKRAQNNASASSSSIPRNATKNSRKAVPSALGKRGEGNLSKGEPPPTGLREVDPVIPKKADCAENIDIPKRTTRAKGKAPDIYPFHPSDWSNVAANPTAARPSATAIPNGFRPLNLVAKHTETPESNVTPQNVSGNEQLVSPLVEGTNQGLSTKRGESLSARTFSPPSDDGEVDSCSSFSADPSIAQSLPNPKPKKDAPSLLDKITANGPDGKTTAHILASSIHPPALKDAASVFNAIIQITRLAVSDTNAKGKGAGVEATKKLRDLAEVGAVLLGREREMEKGPVERREHQQSVGDVIGEKLGSVERKINEVLKRIQDIPSTSKGPSQATAASTSPQLGQKHQPAKQQQQTPQIPAKPRFMVTVSIRDSPDAVEIRSLTRKNLAIRVQSAIQGCDHPSLNDISISGVNPDGRDKLTVFAKSEPEATRLLQHSDLWIARLARGATLFTRAFKIVIHSVSTTFDPENRDDWDRVFDSNPELTRYNVLDIRWLNSKSITRGKMSSSLVITVSTEELANKLFNHGLFIEHALCFGEWYRNGPDQCFTCQEWGHKSYQCPTGIAYCARCAQKHPTATCPCPHTTKCPSVRNCRISPKCVLCERARLNDPNAAIIDSSHFSFDKVCPFRQQAFERDRSTCSSSFSLRHT